MKFGPYESHPVADLFPLMRDTDREGFSGLITDIRDDGLIDPIVLDGNVLLDGRNRYLACVEAEVEPRFIQFKDLGLSISPHVYAFERNQSRRSLTPEQRVTITAAYFRFTEEEMKRQRATAGGKAGGRGRPKQLVTESSQAMPKPKRAKTTRAKLAEATGVSEHKAQQAMNVVQHGSAEQVQAVIAGKVKLSDAAHRRGLEDILGPSVEGNDAQAKATRKPASKFTDKALHKLLATLRDWLDHAPAPMREQITQQVKETSHA